MPAFVRHLRGQSARLEVSTQQVKSTDSDFHHPRDLFLFHLVERAGLQHTSLTSRSPVVPPVRRRNSTVQFRVVVTVHSITN